MNEITQKLDEWKLSQVSRLPKVSLPCPECKQECDVDFDPPLNCPHCDMVFFMKRPVSNRLLQISFAIGVFVMCCVFFSGFYVLFSEPKIYKVLQKLPKPILFAIFLAVIIPFFKFMFSNAVSLTSAAASITSNRENWTRYTNRVSGTRTGFNKPYEVSDAIPKSTICWLHCRTLLCAFKDLLGGFSPSDVRGTIQHDFWNKYRGDLSPKDEKFLRDLLWVDSVLYCLHSEYPQKSGSWGAMWVQRYASDTPELFLAAAAIVGAPDSSDFRALIAEHCMKTAPQLSKLLMTGNAETCREAAILGELMFASEYGRHDIVQVLLAKGADVNAKSNVGRTALIAASSNGRHDIVQVLLAKGADVNAKESNGQTALIYASEKGHKEVVQTLIDQGADVNAKSNVGRTALIAASSNGHKEVVEALLDKGADVNIKNNFGQTALIYASEKGHKEVLQVLLNNGADVNVKQNSGATALMLASQNGHDEVKELLIKAGAK